MLLIDFNQVFLANLFAITKGKDIEEDLVRHTVISSTLSYKKSFSEKYGEIVLCADGNNYWRKTIFPYYKANRKKIRDISKFNWYLIFESLNKIRNEIIEYFPWKVVVVDSAEADDVIAVLVKYFQTNDVEKVGLFKEPKPTLILSGDRDFIQLHSYKNVKQWSPIQKKYIYEKNSKLYLKEKILKGDEGDGIPNFLSDSDTFINPNKRQKPLTKKLLNEILSTNTIPKQHEKNFIRNVKLIDFNYIPKHIEEKIIEHYISLKPNNKNKLLDFFIKNKLKYLTESITNI